MEIASTIASGRVVKVEHYQTTRVSGSGSNVSFSTQKSSRIFYVLENGPEKYVDFKYEEFPAREGHHLIIAYAEGARRKTPVCFKNIDLGSLKKLGFPVITPIIGGVILGWIFAPILFYEIMYLFAGGEFAWWRWVFLSIEIIGTLFSIGLLLTALDNIRIRWAMSRGLKNALMTAESSRT